MVKREENTSLAANSAKILNYIILSLFPELDLNLGPLALLLVYKQTNPQDHGVPRLQMSLQN